MDGYGVMTDVREEGGGCKRAKVGGDSAGVTLGVFATAFGGGRLGRHSCCWIILLLCCYWSVLLVCISGGATMMIGSLTFDMEVVIFLLGVSLSLKFVFYSNVINRV